MSKIARNFDLRIRIDESGLMYKDIAQALGITPAYFSRLMSNPLSEKWRRKITLTLDAMEAMKGEKK